MAVKFSLVLIPFILFFVRGKIYEIPHKNIVDIRTIAEHIEQDVAELKEVLANSTQGQTVKKQDGIGCLDLTGNLKYAGTVSTTSQGLTCQEWSSQMPHDHLFLNDSIFPQDGSAANAKNYCRDPEGEGRPWCYTTQPNVRWQHCSIPVCNKDCWVGGFSRLYYGQESKTENGRTCQRWDSQIPHRHSNDVDSRFPLDDNVGAAANYCRSPNPAGRHWCYTEDPNVRWEFCNVTRCEQV